ncbi:MAG: choice-of-anchor B family protein [Rhodothermaceae bacterium]|nr:choice-of-anchor B family protein [Rhodothermaceae bacterium]MYG70203.1 choice-of-anchor B family protein [Rhodothermaceae bacterium]MYJ45412.1 choice-of-anchor B family protein [Rhodothermaceae bacterium]
MTCSQVMRRSLAPYLFALFVVTPTWANPTDLADWFGRAIATGDGYLFVSEMAGFESPSMVHVYVRGEDQKWVWQDSLHVGGGYGNTIGYGDGVLAVSEGSAVYVFEMDPESARFVQTGRLESNYGNWFGSALALDDGWLAAGSSQRNESTRHVHLFRKNSEGTWVRRAILEEPGESAASMYGIALSMDRGRLLIGSPGLCTAYLYEYQTDGWGLSATLPCGDMSAESMYGMTMDLKGERAVIGAPKHNSSKGAVVVWQQAEDSGWNKINVLAPEEDITGTSFGLQVEIQDPLRSVVGFPVFGGIPGVPVRGGLPGGHGDVEENLRIYAVQDDQDSKPGYTTVPGIVVSGASPVAVDGNLMAIGFPGAAYGEGSAELLEFNGGGWEAVQELYYVYRHIPRRADIRCDDGRADEFDCGLVDLVSFLPNEEMGMNRGVLLSDVWGWTDPETGIEYGLIGHLEGTVFIDLSTPSNPRYLGTLPRTEGSPATIWRDIKVYKDHAFIVADLAREHGMQIFDLTQLRGLIDTPVEFEVTAHYSQIHSAHNIVINEETGFAFAVGVSGGGETCGGGLYMIDIREPQAPVFVGCFADETTGRRKTGYSHDAQCVIYNGPDTEYAGREICFGANETAISISDVTDKENPIAIGTGSYPGAAYVHQGWLTEDHSYFFQNDELDEQYDKVDKTRTLIWDVRDLSDPIMIREFYGPTSATDHNLYIRDNLMYQTNYKSGLRIIDVSSPENPVEIGYFDTTPYGANGAGYDGTLGSYPFFESGIIVVTSIREGVFILKKQSADI